MRVESGQPQFSMACSVDGTWYSLASLFGDGSLSVVS